LVRQTGETKKALQEQAEAGRRHTTRVEAEHHEREEQHHTGKEAARNLLEQTFPERDGLRTREKAAWNGRDASTRRHKEERQS
jgi:hypothetical protein